ncbi:mechanosensitive ion channel [Orbaceae bacterium ESL0721]|nr:mechanosensitive ion channel [Orbaceae bacterium ESL0721]
MESDQIIEKTVSLFEKYDGIILSYIIHLLFAILIFILGRFIGKFISGQIRRILSHRDVDPTVVKFVSTMANYAIMVITLVAVLGQLGVQTASIVAVIGAAGLAVGLALQGSLSNFAAGVLLILFRPFKVGETVTISNLKGTIDSIQIFSTILITPTNEVVIIPNGQIVSTNIINFSRLPERRIDLTVNVGYDSDLNKVRQVLNQAVNKTDNIITNKKPTIRLDLLDSSSINFLVLVWVTNENYNIVRAQLLENIKDLLTENQINIPYPTMDLNVNSNIKN